MQNLSNPFFAKRTIVACSSVGLVASRVSFLATGLQHSEGHRRRVSGPTSVEPSVQVQSAFGSDSFCRKGSTGWGGQPLVKRALAETASLESTWRWCAKAVRRLAVSTCHRTLPARMSHAVRLTVSEQGGFLTAGVGLRHAVG